MKNDKLILYDIIEENYKFIEIKKDEIETTRILKKETLKKIIKIEFWETLSKEQKKIYKNNFNYFYKDFLEDIEVTRVVFNTQKNFGFYNNKKYFNVFKKPALWEKNKDKLGTKTIEIKELESKYKNIFLLINNITNNKVKEKEFLINYLSYIFQTFKKLRHSVIFFGGQGTGKGLFLDYIITKYYNKKNVYIFGNDDLESNFNAFLENKVLLVGNEIKDYTTKNKILNKLKMWITDNNIPVNIKNVNQKMVTNHFNLIIFTNELNPMKIEDSDRRYTLIRTSNKNFLQVLKENKMEFVEWEKNINKEIEKFLIDLLLFKVDDELIKKPLENETKEEIRKKTELKYKLLDKYLRENKQEELLELMLDHVDDFNDNEFEEIFKKYNLNFLEHILIKDKTYNLEKNETIEIFINKIFKRVVEKRYIFSNELKFILKLFYKEKKESELNNMLKNIGNTSKKRIKINNKLFRVREIISNKTKEKNENEIEILKEENYKLREKNYKLRTELEKLKTKILELETKNKSLF